MNSEHAAYFDGLRKVNGQRAGSLYFCESTLKNKNSDKIKKKLKIFRNLKNLPEVCGRNS